MKIIGIAGGSGSGKSTLCYSLMDNHTEVFDIIHLDDYQKLKDDPTIPRLEGIINWDHPEVIRWDDLIKDIQKLLSGREVVTQSWSHRDNVDYNTTGKMIDHMIYPRPVLLLEGYLALWNEELLKFFDRTYFLELSHSARMKRRGKFMDPIYEEKILIPMHEKYIEPSKENADVIIDVSEMDTTGVYQKVKEDFNNSLALNL